MPDEPLDVSTLNLALQAMSLDVPKTPGHVNKRPFSGVLTRLDVLSDAPPGGSGGRLVLLPKLVAEAALPSLLGMGVNMASDVGGHAESHKVGVITAARIEGDAILIEGHLFAKDFPAEMKVIDRLKASLGFSWELTPTKASIVPDNVLRIDEGIFTGAALLLRDAAAYHSTSLAAAALNPSSKGNPMDPEVKAQLDGVAASIAALTALVTPLVASHTTAADAKAKMAPLADLAEQLAAGMAAAGMVSDAATSFPTIARGVALQLRLAANTGSVPVMFDFPGYSVTPMSAAADPAVAAELAAVKAEKVKLAADLASLNTKFDDLKAGIRDKSTPPERQTTSPAFGRLLERLNLTASMGDDGKPKMPDSAAIETALSASKMSVSERIAFKRNLERASQGLES